MVPVGSAWGRGLLEALAVALLVAGAGCGRGSAPGSPSPAPARTPAEVTHVLTFQAYDDVGLLPHLARAASVAGACQGGSAVVAGRADAWRCKSGDVAYDPCFANSTGEEVACAPDPWSATVTVVRLPSPLGRAGSNRTDPSLPAWYLELIDGSRCARTPPAGYRCVSGPGDGTQLGDPDTTRPLWMVRPAGASGFSGEVRTAWY